MVLTCVMLLACTIVDGGAIVTGITHPPISPDMVRVYRVEPENYEEIAIISVSAGHNFKSNSALVSSTVERLKKEAAKLGANGVLLSSINEWGAVKITTSYGTASVQGNNSADIYSSGNLIHINSNSNVYASGNSINVNRGDSYTRMQGLAIYVP